MSQFYLTLFYFHYIDDIMFCYIMTIGFLVNFCPNKQIICLLIEYFLTFWYVGHASVVMYQKSLHSGLKIGKILWILCFKSVPIPIDNELTFTIFSFPN